MYRRSGFMQRKSSANEFAESLYSVELLDCSWQSEPTHRTAPDVFETFDEEHRFY